MKSIKVQLFIFALFLMMQMGAGSNAVAQCNSYSADGTLIEAIGGDGKVYVVFGRKKHWLAGPSIFEGLSYDWSKINKIGRSIFDSFPEGAVIDSVNNNFKNPNQIGGKLNKYYFVYTNLSSQTKSVAYRVKTKKLRATNGGAGPGESHTTSLVYDEREAFEGFYEVQSNRSVVLWNSNNRYEEFWISDGGAWDSTKFTLTAEEVQKSSSNGYQRTVDSYVRRAVSRRSAIDFYKMNSPGGMGCATQSANSVGSSTVPPANNTTSQSGFIRNQLSGKCVDVAGAPGTANGSKVALWDCETSASNTDQKWTMTPEGFIKNQLSGRCLDVAGAPGTANGSPIILYDCEYSDPGTDQKWTITGEGFIKNRLSGKCLDVAGAPGTATGSPLTLYDCEAANSNTDQKWRFF